MMTRPPTAAADTHAAHRAPRNERSSFCAISPKASCGKEKTMSTESEHVQQDCFATRRDFIGLARLDNQGKQGMAAARPRAAPFTSALARFSPLHTLPSQQVYLLLYVQDLGTYIVCTCPWERQIESGIYRCCFMAWCFLFLPRCYYALSID